MAIGLGTHSRLASTMSASGLVECHLAWVVSDADQSGRRLVWPSALWVEDQSDHRMASVKALTASA